MRRALPVRLASLVGLGLVAIIANVASISSTPLTTRDASAQAPTADRPPSSWEGATPLVFARPAKVCRAVRLGEWARVTCKVGEGTVTRLLGGSSEGVLFRETKADGVEIRLHLRPGDRREITVSSVSGGGKYTVEETPIVFLSELWLPGEPEPTIVLASDP